MEPNRRLLSADASPMPVIASIDTKIKIHGLNIPITFDVIENLAYDCIISMSFLQLAMAVIDTSSNTLILYDGLVSIPMTKTGRDEAVVYTVCNVTIPAFSESIFPVAISKKNIKGNHIIEGNLQLPCHSLVVARALVDPSKQEIPCRVLNPTGQAIKLRNKTPIGSLTPVTVVSTTETIEPRVQQLPSVSQMRQALEAKSISFSDTSGVGHILSQKDEGGREHVICYGGRGLRLNETRWSITDLEALALIEGVKSNHTYLINNTFEVVTDHVSLTYLQTMRLSGNNRLTRWALFLQPYKFTISYKRGELLTSADAISRIDRTLTQHQSDASTSEVVINPDDTVANEPSTATVLTSDQSMHVFSDDLNFAQNHEQNTTNMERVDIDFDYGDQKEHLATVSESFQLPSFDDIRLGQNTCSDFSGIIDYLRDGSLPHDDDDKARKIILESHEYVIENGVLYHLYSPRTKHLHRAQAFVKQLCIPANLRDSIAIGLHDLNGHPGFDRLYATARTRYFFKGMYTFLKDHVLTCHTCQVAKRPVGISKVPLTYLSVPAPCTRWHLDFHGPFPESDGKRYILVMIDSTSMWPELIATNDCTAETVATALFDNVVARFGLPRGISLLTDNGSAFISKLASAFSKTVRIKQFLTSPHHPQTNSRAEEFADTIHKSLRALCADQADWSKHLQAIAMAYRATTTTNTAISPHDVIFGKPKPLALDWSLLSEDSTTPSVEAYMRDIRPKLQILHHIAMENARDSALMHARRINDKANPPSFQTGDKVLLFNPTVKKGECAKLKRRYLISLI